jgi:hypothetical protein
VLDPSQVVYFRGYDPSDLRVGVSPIETIRQILAEEHAAGRYREQFWRSHARISGVIERPVEAGEWSDNARSRFQADWSSTWSGEGPGAGGTPILEDGMKWEPATQSARDSQYLESRKLTREEVASIYHVAPTMVGILEHATYSNIAEQHKMTYQDSLAPWLTMIEQEVELQLLHVPGDFADTDQVYVEFNLQEKLKGSFEEQSDSLQTAVGAPWMTRNEGRARLNLPSLGPEGDGLVTPLNVLVGGQASPTDSAPPPKFAQQLKARPDTGAIEEHRKALAGFFERQERVIRSRLGAKAEPDIDELFDVRRWVRELFELLLGLAVKTADRRATELGEQFGVSPVLEVMRAWLENNARISAENVNNITRGQLEKALAAEDVRGEVARVFEQARTVRAAKVAQSRVTTVANFAAVDTAKQAGRPTKTWIVTSPRPRPSHARVNGETVLLNENFSLGGAWPGDPSMGADEVAGCTCVVDFG